LKKILVIYYLLFNYALIIKTANLEKNYIVKDSYKQGIVTEKSEEFTTYMSSSPTNSWTTAKVYENGKAVYQVSNGKLTYFSNGSSKFEFSE